MPSGRPQPAPAGRGHIKDSPVPAMITKPDPWRSALAWCRPALRKLTGPHLVSPMPMHHYWADLDLAARYANAVNAGILDHCAAAPGRGHLRGRPGAGRPVARAVLVDGR